MLSQATTIQLRPDSESCIKIWMKPKETTYWMFKNYSDDSITCNSLHMAVEFNHQFNNPLIKLIVTSKL